jgi:hypothetical protein
MDISSTNSAMDLMAMREEMAANRPVGGAESAGGKSIEDILAEIDADGDGEVTSTEMEEHMEANRPPAPPMSAETGSALTMLQESLNTSSTEDTSLVDTLLEQLEASDEDEEDDNAVAA